MQDTQTLSEYISYAREKIHPQLSEDAARDLTEGYVELRKSSGSRQTVAATPRQLESLVRLSEAIAKMRYAVAESLLLREWECLLTRLMIRVGSASPCASAQAVQHRRAPRRRRGHAVRRGRQ